MEKCIYCGQIITKKNSEHIISNSIGGLLEVDNIICIDCNSNFGETIEASFANQFNFFRNILGIKSGRGEKAPRVRSLKTKSGEEYDLLHGGIANLSKPKVSTWVDEKGRKHVECVLRSEKELERMLKNIDRDEIVFTKYEKIQCEFKEMLSTNISFGGETLFRCIAKTGLNFLTYIFGKDFIFENKFEKVINYIKDATIDSDETISYFSFADYQLPPFFRFGVNHSVIIFNEGTTIKCLVYLFGNISLGCIIGEAELRSSYFYLVDPLAREHFLGEYINPIYLEDLNQSRRTYVGENFSNFFQERLINVMEFWKRYTRMKVVLEEFIELVNDNIDKYSKDESIHPEEIKKENIESLIKESWDEIKEKYDIK